MAKFSRGQYALSISDRSGLAFPYLEMVREWNGAWVHVSEYEPKSPLIQPKPVGADPQSLQRARPARTEFYTPKILPNNPLSTAGSTTVTVNEPDHGRSTGDAVRFRNVVSYVGGVSPSIFGLETTLASDLTDSATTLTLSDASAFPTSGYIVVNPGANDNETIKYTGKSSNDLTGLTRGSSAPTYNLAPLVTTASAHSSGVQVRGSYSITKVDDDSYTFTLASAASTTETGGGFPIFAGPVNARA
jgi:hypothetical protein|tara:strand:- start:2090 stop:2827 length:738 start_codon:yes stop_codon:yes gene_type:complete